MKIKTELEYILKDYYTNDGFKITKALYLDPNYQK